MERPALQKLLDDVKARKIDVIVVYKVDRLTRSLADFAKLVELFDAHGVSFISVTQAFNTTTSKGRRGEATAARRTKRMSDEALATDRPPERESDAPPVERLAPVSNMAILRWIFGQP